MLCGRTVLIFLVIGLGLVSASWDGPVQTIEREETIQSANNAAGNLRVANNIYHF